MKISIREAINQTLHQEMERDERVIVLGEDVASDQGGVYGITDGLPAKFGLHRVIDTPITESAIVGAAGGVGSIMLQLLKSLTGATVIATASRESSKSWVQELGADHVVDHSKPMAEQIKALNVGEVTHVASLNNTHQYIEDYVEVMKPKGRLALIDDPESLDVAKLKQKSLSLHWEFMFTRSMFETDDMVEQSRLLTHVASLIDEGKIKTTVGKHLGKINAENLIEAHRILEEGRAIGKLVLEGF